jgi:hypothetical protein
LEESKDAWCLIYIEMRLGIFLSMVLGVFAQNSVVVKDCSIDGSAFTIEKLSFDPPQPVPGQNGTLTTVYTVPSAIDGGQAHYSCSLNGLPVYDETFDLCSQTDCPVAVGEHTDTSVSAVPSTSGKVDCKISWTDMASQPLMCIQMIFKLT